MGGATTSTARNGGAFGGDDLLTDFGGLSVSGSTPASSATPGSAGFGEFIVASSAEKKPAAAKHAPAQKPVKTKKPAGNDAWGAGSSLVDLDNISGLPRQQKPRDVRPIHRGHGMSAMPHQQSPPPALGNPMGMGGMGMGMGGMGMGGPPMGGGRGGYGMQAPGMGMGGVGMRGAANPNLFPSGFGMMGMSAPPQAVSAGNPRGRGMGMNAMASMQPPVAMPGTSMPAPSANTGTGWATGAPSADPYGF